MSSNVGPNNARKKSRLPPSQRLHPQCRAVRMVYEVNRRPWPVRVFVSWGVGDGIMDMDQDGCGILCVRDASGRHARTRTRGKKVICSLRRNAQYACSGGSCCFYASCPWLGEAVMHRATMWRLASGQKRVRPFSKHAAMVSIWHTGTGSQAISPP